MATHGPRTLAFRVDRLPLLNRPARDDETCNSLLRLGCAIGRPPARDEVEGQG